MFGIHKVQFYIMRCLWEYEEIGFAESRPKSVTGSLYSYHLSALVQNGVIEEVSDGRYALTRQGRGFVDGIFSETVKSKKIDLKIIAHDKDGNVKIINGKLLDGDSRTHAGAIRIAQKKLSCKNPNLEHVGDAYIKIYNDNNDVLEYSLSHIFELKNIVDLSKVGEYLPQEAKEEILFVKDNSDGHFFFERDYLL